MVVARSILGVKSKLAIVATALGAGAGAAAIAKSDDPATSLKLCTTVPVRLFRLSVTAATIAFDYEYSLCGLPEDGKERARVKHEVHTRSARRLEELCLKNGGIYIKLGQHISQLEYLVPQEYINTLRESMLNKCPTSSYDQVCQVINRELGGPPEEELDFLNEAKNSVKCMDNFRRLSPHIAEYVYAPMVYWNLSTTKLLTMEFVEGAQVNDLKTIKKLGLSPYDITRLVSRTFAEMMFKHGFVHCDPHEANLIIRTMPAGRSGFFGRRKPQLVLLDHGLYKELDNSTRTNYAALWKGLVLADAKAIKENCLKFGAGEDLYALFAGILTMRPWNRVIDPAVDHLAIKGNPSDQSELQMYASLYFPQITELLHKLPRVILLMLKTNDCLRAVNNTLIGRPSVESFIIIGRVSSEALIQEKLLRANSVIGLVGVWLDEVSMEVRFLLMEFALWMLHFRRALMFYS